MSNAIIFLLLLATTLPAQARGQAEFGAPPGAEPRRHCSMLGAMYEAIGFHRSSGFGPGQTHASLGAYREIDRERQIRAINRVYYSPQFANPDMSGLGEYVTAKCLAESAQSAPKR